MSARVFNQEKKIFTGTFFAEYSTNLEKKYKGGNDNGSKKKGTRK
jgi:hypothetical protein